MTQRIFLLFLLFLPVFTHGQTVHVKKESARVHGENILGYQVALAASGEDVQKALEKYLKTLGKTKLADDIFATAEPLIGGKKYANALYATTRELGTTTAAWIGMDYKAGEERYLDRDLEKLAYDFGVTFYRDKIQLQVDESLRALQTVEKQQARLVNQNKDLNNKIESNKREKIQLEKSLSDNKMELEDLIKRFQANIKAQDSIAVATEQIRKVVEMHKERQEKVN